MLLQKSYFCTERFPPKNHPKWWNQFFFGGDGSLNFADKISFKKSCTEFLKCVCGEFLNINLFTFSWRLIYFLMCQAALSLSSNEKVSSTCFPVVGTLQFSSYFLRSATKITFLWKSYFSGKLLSTVFQITNNIYKMIQITNNIYKMRGTIFISLAIGSKRFLGLSAVHCV